MDTPALKSTRRHLLLGIGGAAVAALALPHFRSTAGDRTRRILASNPLTRRFVSLADAEQDEWAAQVGTTFTASGGYRLRLAGVEPLSSSGERPADVTRASAFVAVFDVLDGRTMAGNVVHALSHPGYGALPLFMTSGSAGRMLAVFN